MTSAIQHPVRRVLVFGCPDPRQPSRQLAKELGGALLSVPGADPRRIPLSVLRRWYPGYMFIFAPHQLCLANALRGGDDVGLDNAIRRAQAMSREGMPSAVMQICDGIPPTFCLDQLGCGHDADDLRRSIYTMLDREELNWDYDHEVAAKAVVVGHHFSQLASSQSLRFSSSIVVPRDMRMIGEIVETFSRGVARPLHFSREVGQTERARIKWLFESHSVPVHYQLAA